MTQILHNTNTFMHTCGEPPTCDQRMYVIRCVTSYVSLYIIFPLVVEYRTKGWIFLMSEY